MGEHLDSLINYCETMVWGGTAANGDTVSWAGGSLIGAASALGALLCVFLAARIAYESMAEGKPIDVLALFRPLAIALVLANWYAVTSGLYSICRPIENRFRSLYVYSNQLTDSLRDRRDTLSLMLRFEVDSVRTDALIAEIRQRYGMTEEEEIEAPESMVITDGDGNDISIDASYGEPLFAEVLHEELDTETDEHGNEQPKLNVREMAENAYTHTWTEDVLVWIAEVIWSVGLYLVFLVKYLFLYVLVMFGPIFIACCVLDTWSDKWTDWLGRFVVVSMYGTAAYMALVFGMMIIQGAVLADIEALELLCLGEDPFLSYLNQTSRLSGLATLGTYFIALLVTAIAIGMSFELAGMVFPGGGLRSAGNFFQGMSSYIQTKAKQAQEAAVEAVLTVATAAVGAAAGAAAAAVDKEVMKALQDELSGDGDAEGAETADASIPPSSDTGAAIADAEEDVAGDGRTDWQRDAEQDRRKEEELKQFVEQLRAEDPALAEMFAREDDIHMWADRTAYEALRSRNAQPRGEDFAAALRDARKAREVDALGYGQQYENLRQARLRENFFLLQMVGCQGRTVSSLTLMQKLAIRLFGEKWARRIFGRSWLMGRSFRHGSLKRAPRLTSWGALLGMDTMTSPRENREMLKSLGLYRHMLRAEVLRRITDALASRTRFGRTSFLWIPYRRNWLHEHYYLSAHRHLASTEALIAMRAREILAERDIHVDEHGRLIDWPDADLYWRRDVGYRDYRRVSARLGEERFANAEEWWFMQRYADIEKARKLRLELDVLEAKLMADDAEDFVISRQLAAEDEYERLMWRSMADSYFMFKRVRDRLDDIIDMHGGAEGGSVSDGADDKTE